MSLNSSQLHSLVAPGFADLTRRFGWIVFEFIEPKFAQDLKDDAQVFAKTLALNATDQPTVDTEATLTRQQTLSN